jgi:Ser/Thr protein kinase RdoA (MazF antagonist)
MASRTLPPPVADAVQRWNGLVQTATHVRSSSNHIFKFRRANQWLFLRLSPRQKRSKVQIDAELDFVRHIANVGVPVAMPLQSLRELFIEEVDWGEHLYYAVVFEGLHGRQWSDPNDLTLTLFKEWGSTLAKIHRASQTFVSGSSPRRPSWKDSLREAREWLPAEDKIAHYELSVTSEWLMSMPIDAENYGLIHRDPELDNLI